MAPKNGVAVWELLRIEFVVDQVVGTGSDIMPEQDRHMIGIDHSYSSMIDSNILVPHLSRYVTMPNIIN